LWLAFGSALTSALACAKVENPFQDAALAEVGVKLPNEVVDGSIQCVSVTEPRSKHSCEILILLDRSESMGSEFDGVTRFQAAQSELAAAISTYGAGIQFAFQVMPSEQKPCALGCCAAGPSIALSDTSLADVATAIASTSVAVGGKTPTATALSYAWDYFADVEQGIGSEAGRISRYVLLVTDGAPNCTLGGEASAKEYVDATGRRIGACADAVNAVAAMNTGSNGDGGPGGLVSPVQVIVVGMGTAAMDEESLRCLKDMAQRGGQVVPSPDKRAGFIGVETRSELAQTLTALLETMPPRIWGICDFPVENHLLFNGVLKVQFDGVDVPKEDVVSDNQGIVTITGDSCKRLLGTLSDGNKTPVKKVEIFSCPGAATGSL
jgi:hypothetical protein